MDRCPKCGYKEEQESTREERLLALKQKIEAKNARDVGQEIYFRFPMEIRNRLPRVQFSVFLSMKSTDFTRLHNITSQEIWEMEAILEEYGLSFGMSGITLEAIGLREGCGE